MATYKVLQDIEADDKLFGPFSLKQFIFAGIAIGFGVAAFFIATSSVPIVFKIPMVVALLPPMALFGFLSAPLSHDQTAEVWLLARISFLFKPRQRIWNQDGISDLVTITAPKREEHVYSNNLSQTEVKSRLQALANTVDSRGWAIKNVNTNMFAQPGYLDPSSDSDRLVDPVELPQEVPIVEITASDDMLDVSNSTAQHLELLIQQSASTHRDQAISAMQPESTTQTSPTDYWFLNQTTPTPEMPLPKDATTFQNQQVVAPGGLDAHPAAEETAEEHKFAEKLAHHNNDTYERYIAHTKTLQPIHDHDGNLIKPKMPETPKPKLEPVDAYAAIAGQSPDASMAPDTNSNFAVEPFAGPTPKEEPAAKPKNPEILRLAGDNDKNIDVLGREANRISDDDGVVLNIQH